MSRLYDRVMTEGYKSAPLGEIAGSILDTTLGQAEAVGASPRSVIEPGLPVIEVDGVAEYAADGVRSGDLAVNSLFGVIRPPFDRCFMEFAMPPSLGAAVSVGWIITIEDSGPAPTEASDVPDENRSWASDVRWFMDAHLLIEMKKERISGPWGKVSLPLDGHGQPIRQDTETKGPQAIASLDLPDFSRPLTEDEARFHQWWVLVLFMPVAFGLSLLHCRNVEMRTVEPNPKLSSRRLKKRGHPLTTYYTLEIAPMRRILDGEGEAQTKGLGHALHICRGHFKTFTEDAPLFGKRVGTYWWPAHARGNPDEGVIEKDYRVKFDGDGFGQSYREADEAVTVAPAEVRADDPDTSQRGLRAHNRTQNLLASALTEAGFSPRSPKPDEPDFDLAWVDGDTIWVAEVKSTTEANEEHQLRLAIGQVIRYRDRLATEGASVRAMIAAENAPSDETWIDLCGREGIALVWPEVMAQALAAE